MPEEPEEQLEFLRREDIRTMAKDMARLREEESKKEREKIVQLQGGGKGQQAAAPSPGQPTATPEPPRTPLMPSGFEAIGGELPRPLSRTKKTLVRVAVILLVLFVAANAIALAYSFWKRSAPQETQVQTPEPTPPAAEPAPQQEKSSLPFPVGKIVPVSSLEDISKLLSEELTQGVTGVSFEGVQTPLSMLGINLSEQVRPLVRPSFLLFLHTLGEKKRFGLAFTLNGTEAAMKEAVTQWEPNMEKDTS
ncbi:MAG: hypothetical protein Q7R48_02220, partial [bacterium]|nr:hypothetical protein [bacterium]